MQSLWFLIENTPLVLYAQRSNMYTKAMLATSTRNKHFKICRTSVLFSLYIIIIIIIIGSFVFSGDERHIAVEMLFLFLAFVSSLLHCRHMT